MGNMQASVSLCTCCESMQARTRRNAVVFDQRLELEEGAVLPVGVLAHPLAIRIDHDKINAKASSSLPPTFLTKQSFKSLKLQSPVKQTANP